MVPRLGSPVYSHTTNQVHFSALTFDSEFCTLNALSLNVSNQIEADSTFQKEGRKIISFSPASAMFFFLVALCIGLILLKSLGLGSEETSRKEPFTSCPTDISVIHVGAELQCPFYLSARGVRICMIPSPKSALECLGTTSGWRRK